MIELSLSTLLALLAAPAAVAIASLWRIEAEKLRRLALVSATTLLLATIALAASAELRGAALAGGWVALPRLGGSPLFRVDALSEALLPFTALLWLVTVGVTPRAFLKRAGIRRSAISTLVTLLTFLSDNPLVLAASWTLSTGLLLAALSEPEHRRVRRVAAGYLGGSTVLLLVGLALTVAAERLAPDHGLWIWVEPLGLALVVTAALVRKAIFPFHAWAPELFERGRLGPVTLFSAPQVGAYVVAVLVVPRAPDGVLRLVAVLALSTAVYGAALALVQSSARRAVGYLFMSQSALVLVGLDCTSREALAGGLCVWISSGIAFAGLARCLLVLEARRGRMSLSRLNGGFERIPLLAASFLLMGLACTGFPGTFGFVGGELLVGGAVSAFPLVGFAVVVAAGLTGLGVVRMYFALFCGRRDPSPHLRLQPRERYIFAAVAGVLLVTGMAPGPLVESRSRAAADLLSRREHRRAPSARGLRLAPGPWLGGYNTQP